MTIILKTKARRNFAVHLRDTHGLNAKDRMEIKIATKNVENLNKIYKYLQRINSSLANHAKLAVLGECYKVLSIIIYGI